MNSRLRSLVHPVRAWLAYTAALAARADAAALAAGLTVEVLSGRTRRYRDPRLDQLTEHRDTAGPAESSHRIPDRRTEHDGPIRPYGAGAVPAPTVPGQGRCGFASASHATAYGGP